MPSRLMFSMLLTNVPELAVSVRVLLAGLLFHIGSQAIVVLSEQATDHWLADSVPFLVKTFFNVSQTTVEPLFIAHRIACCMGRHDV